MLYPTTLFNIILLILSKFLLQLTTGKYHYIFPLIFFIAWGNVLTVLGPESRVVNNIISYMLQKLCFR